MAKREKLFFLIPSATARGVGKHGSCSVRTDGEVVVSMVTDFFFSCSATKYSKYPLMAKFGLQVGHLDSPRICFRPPVWGQHFISLALHSMSCMAQCLIPDNLANKWSHQVKPKCSFSRRAVLDRGHFGIRRTARPLGSCPVLGSPHTWA